MNESIFPHVEWTWLINCCKGRSLGLGCPPTSYHSSDMLLIDLFDLNSSRLDIHHEDSPIVWAHHDILPIGWDTEFRLVLYYAALSALVSLMCPSSSDLLPSSHVPQLDCVISTSWNDYILIRWEFGTSYFTKVCALKGGDNFTEFGRPDSNIFRVACYQLLLRCWQVKIVNLVRTAVATYLFRGKHIPVSDCLVVRATDNLLLAKIYHTGVNRVIVAQILHQFVISFGAINYHLILV